MDTVISIPYVRRARHIGADVIASNCISTTSTALGFATTTRLSETCTHIIRDDITFSAISIRVAVGRSFDDN